MSLRSINQSGLEYSSKREREVEKIQRDRPTTRVKRKREQETTEKRTLVLGLPANSNLPTKIRGREKESGETGRKGQTDSEYKKTELAESQSPIQTHSLGINGSGESQDCDVDDDDGSWPLFFADQLRKINEEHLLPQEEDIPMLPNTFFKDLLEL